MPMPTTDERTRAYKLAFVPVQKCLDAGRFPDALAELERVTAADPDCAQAHNDLAVLYHAAGRLIDADRESRRAVEIDPFHGDIRENRDAIVAALTSATSATSATSGTTTPPAMARASAAAPVPALDNAPVYREALRKAEALLAAGQLDAAVAEIESFVERAPATAEAWNDLGVLHRDGGRLQAAHAALVVALTIEPTNLLAGHNLAGVLFELGHHDEALRALEPLLIRDPRDVEALTLAGDISLALRQTDDASAFYRAALAIDPANIDLVVKLTNVHAASVPAATAPATAPRLVAPVFAPVSVPVSVPVPEGARVFEYDPRARLLAPDESYDVVSCKTPLDHLPNPIAALAEMVRIVRPGGKLWIDLGGPLEVTKHAAPGLGTQGPGLTALPAARGH